MLLTGAAGGLGQAIARSLSDRRATLVLSGRNADALGELANGLPGEHRFVVADLAEDGAAERLAAEAGQVEVLVANAGVGAGGRLARFSEERLVEALRVNLESPIRLTRGVLGGMLERGSGHVVLISSLQGKVALAHSSVYTATKFGLRGFGLALRDELSSSGVGVSVVLPGFIRDAGLFARSGVQPPAGLGTSTPGEVGEAVVTAIERNRAEVDVAPVLQRLGAGFALRAPRVASRVTRVGAARVTDKVVEGQERG